MYCFNTDSQPHAGHSDAHCPTVPHSGVAAPRVIDRGFRSSAIYKADDQVIGLAADVTIAHAGQRTSPTTVTICVYAGVS
jgi:hypothetical protein